MMVLAAGVLASCAGHGTYTTKAKADAEARMAEIKAATDYDLAHQQFESGDLDRALRTVDRSLMLTPDAPKGYLLRGRVLLEMGRAEESLASLDRGAELAPADALFPYYRGVVLESVGRREQALDAYQRAMSLDPANLQYVMASAEVLVEMKRPDEAERLLLDAVARAEFSAGLRQMLGHVAMMKGEPSRAADEFAQAAVLAADSPAVLEDLASAQIASGRFTEAEQTLRRLCDRPEYRGRRDVQHMRARCLVELGRPVEAREVLVRLTSDRQGASDVDAWARLADVALMMNDDHQLRTASSRLISIAPDRYEGYLAQAMWQRRAGDLPAALRSVDKAIERAGDSGAPQRLRALILDQLSRADSAGFQP